MPQSQVRRVEREEYPDPRPRDTALSRAANDNARYVAANDNPVSRNPNQRSVDEEFSDSYYQQGLQPSVGTVEPIRKTEVTYFNKAASNDNARAKSTPKKAAIDDSFKKIPKPARKLVGKALAVVPPQAKVAIVAAALLLSRKKVTRANLYIYSWAVPLYVGIQLPIALLSLGFLGMTYILQVAIPKAVQAGIEAVAGETAGRIIYSIGSTVYNYTFGPAVKAADWLFEKIFGFSLVAAGDPANYFIATHFLVFMIGAATLILIALIYTICMVNPFFGKGAGLKIGGFLIALCGYLIPGLNFLPWFFVWTFAVWLKAE